MMKRFSQRRSSALWPLLLGLLLVLGAGLLTWRYFATRRAVTVYVNGARFVLRTHQTSAEGVLGEAGIVLYPEDGTDLPSSADLVAGAEIRLELARPIAVVGGEGVIETRTRAASILQALDGSAATLLEGDRFLVRGRLVDPGSPLPDVPHPVQMTLSAWIAALRHPLNITIRRATPITVLDGDRVEQLRSAALTVGEALQDQGIALYEGDSVDPVPQAPVSEGLIVRIERSLPVTLVVGGQGRMTRSREETVDALLDESAVSLNDLDYVLPSLDAALVHDLLVRVVRVIEERYVQEIPIAFETIYQPDPGVEIDNQQIVSWGREGAERRQVLVHYEDQAETSRVEEEIWIEREPRDRIIEYGTKIILRQLDTPAGPISYWRKLRILATSYNAPTAGKPADHPTYGITRLGWRARKGIIAVDPRVINMEQDMYVSDYGLGVAADTGGAIKWRRIDLCYDDDNLVLWKKWVDVYLLEPIPSTDEITWIIPNYPVEKE